MLSIRCGYKLLDGRRRNHPMFSFLTLLILAQQAWAQSPTTIHLQARVAPLGSSFKRRAVSPFNLPLQDFFLGTDLQLISPFLPAYHDTNPPFIRWFGNISGWTFSDRLLSSR